MPQTDNNEGEEARRPSLQTAIKTAMAEAADRPARSSGRSWLLIASAVAAIAGAGVLGGVYQNHQLRDVEAASIERQRVAQELDRTVQARASDLTRREAEAKAREGTQAEERRKAAEEFAQAVRTRQAELAQRQAEVEARDQAMTTLVRGQQLELARREAAVEIREQAVTATERRLTEQAAQLETQAAELQKREKQIEANIEEAFHDKRLLSTISLAICNQSGGAIQIARASTDPFSFVTRRYIEQWIPIENGACERARVGPGRAYVYARSSPDGAKTWNDLAGNNLQCLSPSAAIVDWRPGNVTCSAHEVRAAFIEIDLKDEETTFTLR
ncbi:hypothetical protein ACJ4V0_20735 [Phreatobacter sp. HK31-P]